MSRQECDQKHIWAIILRCKLKNRRPKLLWKNQRYDRWECCLKDIWSNFPILLGECPVGGSELRKWFVLAKGKLEDSNENDQRCRPWRRKKSWNNLVHLVKRRQDYVETYASSYKEEGFRGSEKYLLDVRGWFKLQQGKFHIAPGENKQMKKKPNTVF